MEDTCSLKDDDSPLTKEIKSVILKDLSTRYDSLFTENLLYKCTFLDPRFKTGLVKDMNSILSDIENEIIECSSLVELAPIQLVESSSNDQASSSEASEPPAKKAKGLTAILNHILPKLQPN